MFKIKPHITSKTLSKLGIRLETGGALFPLPRHLIRGLVVFINDQIYSSSYNCSLHYSILGKNY